MGRGCKVAAECGDHSWMAGLSWSGCVRLHCINKCSLKLKASHGSGSVSQDAVS